ncbi:MAG: hypothetical protein K8W52_28955 [Deltaproteobacteria bacterium]|nr:hypothetical protein [Deltaproteobacteria bacterium]
MRIALLVLVLAGCADGVPLDELDDAYTRARCEVWTRCGYYDSLERCVAQPSEQARLVTPSLRAAVEAGVVIYDPIQAEECLRLTADIVCNPGDLARRVPSVTCIGMFRSGRPVGAACAFQEECASRTCEFNVGCDPGTCCAGVCAAVKGVGGIGASCLENECGPTSFCYQETCVPLLRQGMACASNNQCDFGLVCLDTCQPPRAAGEACEFTAHGWDCGGDVFCDRTSLRCDPFLPLGAACEPDHDRCAHAYAWCEPTTSTCAPLPTRGQPCPSGRCGDDSWCAALPPDGSICAAPVPDGAQCSWSGYCASGVCSLENVCVPEPVCI